MAEWTPQLAFADENVAIAHAGRVIAHFWYRHIEVAAIQQLERVIAERAADGPLAAFTVVQPNAIMPEQTARDMAAASLDSVAEHLAVSAVVIEGVAMQSAAFRGLVAGFTMLARRGYPHEVFDSVGDAARWMAKHAPRDLDLGAERLESIVEELRALPR